MGIKLLQYIMLVQKKLRILHFNDVYNVTPSSRGDVCGGAARFVHLVNSFRPGGDNHDSTFGSPLVFFSGDAFNPSMMSTVTKGAQMVPVLNALNLTAACYGNHDFDFGVDNLLKLKNKSNFPWFISNVKVKETGEQLADGEITKMILHPETGAFVVYVFIFFILMTNYFFELYFPCVFLIRELMYFA